jgi:hypothetical protein
VPEPARAGREAAGEGCRVSPDLEPLRAATGAGDWPAAETALRAWLAAGASDGEAEAARILFKGHTDLFDRIRRDETKRAAAQEADSYTGNIPGHPGYYYDDGGVWRISRDGPPQSFLPWYPEVLRAGIKPQEGSGPSGRVYEIRIVNRDQPVSPDDDRYPVTHADLQEGLCWHKIPGLSGTVRKSNRDLLAGIVETQAADIKLSGKMQKAFGHPGWHEINGQRVYAFDDGRTIPAGFHVWPFSPDEKMAEYSTLPGQLPGMADTASMLWQLADRGHAPLFFLGVGIRALGNSICRVDAGAAVSGEPYSGKTCSVALALAVRFTQTAKPFPPFSVATFDDAPGGFEGKISRARDSAFLVDDLALPHNANPAEIRDKTGKLDNIFRKYFNDQTIRERMNKDASLKVGNQIHGVPVITMQRVPATMQESLYQRLACLYIRKGDVDTDWYEANWPRVALALRSLGEAVITRLAESEAPQTILTVADSEAFQIISGELDRELADWKRSGMARVAKAFAQHCAGLALATEASGIDDRWLFVREIMPMLISCMVRQSGEISERQEQSDNFGVAVGEIVRDAFTHNRAHIRNKDDLEAPCIPGLTPQEQGVSFGEFVGGIGYRGRGVPFYWLAEHDGIGASSANLHALLRDSRDARAQEGGSVRMLPGRLLEAGVAVPSGQKDRAASHLVRIGSGPKRLVILRREAVWPDAQSTADTDTALAENYGYNGYNGYSPGQEPNGESLADLTSGPLTSDVAVVAVVTDVLSPSAESEIVSRVPAPRLPAVTEPSQSVAVATEPRSGAAVTVSNRNQARADALSRARARIEESAPRPVSAWGPEDRDAAEALGGKLRILAALEGGRAQKYGPYATMRKGCCGIPNPHGPYLSPWRNGEMPWQIDDAVYPRGFNWKRDYSGETVTLDRNGDYVAAAATVNVAHGKLIHREGPCDLSDAKSRPGYYLAHIYSWQESGMPSPCGIIEPGQDAWIPAPLAALLADLAAEGRWPDSGAADSLTGDPARLADWAHFVNELRRFTLETYGRHSIEYNAVKAGFGIARMIMRGTAEVNGAMPRRVWKNTACRRADWAQHIETQASCTIWRKADALRKLDSDYAPVSLRNTDELSIPAGVLTELTGGENPALRLDSLGTILGTWKIKRAES